MKPENVIGYVAQLTIPCKEHSNHRITIISKDDMSWLAAEALGDCEGWEHAICGKYEVTPSTLDRLAEILGAAHNR